MTTSTHKVGVFASERELQKELAGINDIDLDGAYTTTFVRREVPVKGCIPDLVYVRFQNVPDSGLWPAKWSFYHTFVVWLLRHKPQLRLEAIAEECYEPPTGRIQVTLRDLAKSGAVEKLETGEIKLSSRMQEVEAEVIAVEAKLKRWREAMDQAESYQEFADQVFVAMDAALVPREPEVLVEFENKGIGLCAVMPGSIEWLVYPRCNSRSSAEKEYLITSAASCRQTLWSRRYRKNASNQA